MNLRVRGDNAGATTRVGQIPTQMERVCTGSAGQFTVKKAVNISIEVIIRYLTDLIFVLIDS